jgi:hypothetical protein
MKNTNPQPVNQHQQGRQHHQQLNQQQKTRLEQGPKKQAENPTNLQSETQYQEHEHPEARLTR